MGYVVLQQRTMKEVQLIAYCNKCKSVKAAFQETINSVFEKRGYLWFILFDPLSCIKRNNTNYGSFLHEFLINKNENMPTAVMNVDGLPRLQLDSETPVTTRKYKWHIDQMFLCCEPEPWVIIGTLKHQNQVRLNVSKWLMSLQGPELSWHQMSETLARIFVKRWNKLL